MELIASVSEQFSGQTTLAKHVDKNADVSLVPLSSKAVNSLAARIVWLFFFCRTEAYIHGQSSITYSWCYMFPCGL